MLDILLLFLLLPLHCRPLPLSPSLHRFHFISFSMRRKKFICISFRSSNSFVSLLFVRTIFECVHVCCCGRCNTTTYQFVCMYGYALCVHNAHVFIHSFIRLLSVERWLFIHTYSQAAFVTVCAPMIFICVFSVFLL